MLKYLRITNSNWFTNIALMVILLLPLFIYANILYPFNFGRFIIFWWLIIAMLMGAILTPNLLATRTWWKSKIFWISIIWLVVLLITAFTGEHFVRSFWGTVNRTTGWMLFFSLQSLILMLLITVRTKENWLKIFSWISWIGSLSAVYTVLQKFGITLIYRLPDADRLGGLIGNPIFLGMFLLLTIFLTGYFVLQSVGKIRILYGSGLVLQLIAIFLTISRGPLLGLIAGLMVFGIGWWLLTKKTKKINWLWPGIGTAIVFLSGILVWLLDLPFARIFDFSLSNETIQQRFLAWGILWEAIKAKPIFGWGLENTEIAFNEFYQPGAGYLGVGETVFDRAHNLIFEHLTISGILGGVMLVLFVYFVTKALINKIKSSTKSGDTNTSYLALALLATGVAYFVASLTAFDVVSTLIIGSIIFAGTIFLTSKPLEDTVSIKWMAVFPIVLLIIFLVTALKVMMPAFVSGTHVSTARKATKAGVFTVARLEYNKAQHSPNIYLNMMLSGYPAYARQHSLELMEQENHGGAKQVAIDGLVVLGRVAEANPGNPLIQIDGPLLNIIISRYEKTRLEKAYDMYYALVERNPNREYLYMNWARITMGVKDFDEAKIALEQAAALSVPPKELEFWRATWGMESGRGVLAEMISDFKISADKKVSFLVGEEDALRRAISLLANNQEWSIAKYYQEKLISLDPKNVEELINMSAIYAEVKDFDKAAEYARKVVELDPTKKEQTEAFLQTIGQTL